MKKLWVLLVIFLLAASSLEAAVTYKIKGTVQQDDMLIVKVEFTDGTHTLVLDQPHFQPRTKVEVLNRITNMCNTLQAKWTASDLIKNTVKPDVDKEISVIEVP